MRSRGRAHSFSLIEIMVTLAIIGMLTVTILPTLGKYNRTNNVVISGQSLREALGEVRSYAVSPDPTVCPALGPITRPINEYALFLSSPAGGTNTPVYDPNGGSQTTYECGTGAAQVALSTNQFAILARSLGTDASGNPVEYNVGIVRIGSLDSPAVANVPIQGAAAKAVLVGYKSPSGSFFGTSIAGFNYVPATNNVVSLPNNVTKTTTAAADKLYYLIGIADQYPIPTYALPIFINNATGQITSNGCTPSGFTPVGCP